VLAGYCDAQYITPTKSRLLARRMEKAGATTGHSLVVTLLLGNKQGKM